MLFCIILCVPVAAQGKADQALNLRATIAAARAEVQAADSEAWDYRRVQYRLDLAALLKGKEATALVEEAVAIADSSGELDAGFLAYPYLLETYRKKGDLKRALRASMRIDSLWARRWEENAVRQKALLADLDAEHAQERDSLVTAYEQSLSEARTQVSVSQREVAAREVMLAAMATVAIVIITILVLVLRRSHRRAIEHMRTELGDLQARIAAMAEEMKGVVSRMEAQRTAPPTTPSPEATAPKIEQEAPSPDPMVLALFKRQAPERITALNTARAAGDHEKVLRVLHSLRPQLDALDPDGLGASCARLRAMQPSDADWDAGLDRLVAGMHAMMAQR